MRHRVGQRKLGRVTEHRIAMLRSQAERLIQYEHLQTTVPKAKELRPFVERIITIAKRGIARGESNGGALHGPAVSARSVGSRWSTAAERRASPLWPGRLPATAFHWRTP